jgi:hypothetical protein
VAGFAYFKILQLDNQMKQLNPFEAFPDDGENPGVSKQGRRVLQITYPDSLATRPLPAEHQLALGQKGRFGDLEVTPLEVRREKVKVRVGPRKDQKAQECTGDSLVLRVRLANISQDLTFAPLDSYFGRKWKLGLGPMPLTYLEANDHRFFGTTKWIPPEQRERLKEFSEYVEGQPLAELPPADAGNNHIEGIAACTDGNDPEDVRLLFGDRRSPPCPGPFLWRVRLRRGLIESAGKERSATTVIGVMFPRSAIVERNNS